MAAAIGTFGTPVPAVRALGLASGVGRRRGCEDRGEARPLLRLNTSNTFRPLVSEGIAYYGRPLYTQRRPGVLNA